MPANEKKTLALHAGKKNGHIAIGYLLIRSITIIYILICNDSRPLNDKFCYVEKHVIADRCEI